MLRIAGGRVHDPANGVDGVVADVCLRDGKVVADLPGHAPRIDARGMVVMPGGVEIHAQIAGAAVNAARRLTPEEQRVASIAGTARLRGGGGGTTASTAVTGHRFARLGYTTVVNAGTGPLTARQTLGELRDTPVIDSAVLILLGNNLPLFDLIRRAGPEAPGPVTDAVAWWLRSTAAFGVELVNPGGVELWKRRNLDVRTFDEEIGGLGVTPRRVVETIAAAVDELGLPHPVRVHGHGDGARGDWRMTRDALTALDGRRAHLPNVHDHALDRRTAGRARSHAGALIDHLAEHPEHSADVGPVTSGAAMTTTADAPRSARQHRHTNRKWVSADLEAESGGGTVPVVRHPGDYGHALRWAIGLELLLRSPDPWRLVMSTDHPSAGSFVGGPRLIRLLMDRGFRDERIRAANPHAIRDTALADGLEREYTLDEIAIITRAAPARLLGLVDKGHLGPGADADVTVYADGPDREAMFTAPRYVIKDGRVVIADRELRDEAPGTLLRVAVDHDERIASVLRPLVDERYSVGFDSYVVEEPWLLHPARAVPARGRRPTREGMLVDNAPVAAGHPCR